MPISCLDCLANTDKEEPKLLGEVHFFAEEANTSSAEEHEARIEDLAAALVKGNN